MRKRGYGRETAVIRSVSIAGSNGVIERLMHIESAEQVERHHMAFIAAHIEFTADVHGKGHHTRVRISAEGV